jgi:mannitol-1-phosphate 5-dehydrogenase
VRALHFGAGNIGRGFVGQLLHEAGYGVTFADVDAELVEALERRGRYDVIMADERGERITVGPVSALNSGREAERLSDALAEADLVTTAVGPTVLPALAPAVAAGLTERARRGAGPVNVIACENAVGASQALRDSVLENVLADYRKNVDRLCGFPNAAVDRIVPEQGSRGLDVLVEPFFEWVVDVSQVNGETPRIQGVTYVEDLGPYIERKLLTVNTGHSAVAYLGHARGKATILEALDDGSVRETVSRDLEETGTLLCRRHGFDPDEHARYRRKVLERFTNPYISDYVTRVARAPIRKLGRRERFVAPALGLLEIGYEPVNLAKTIGAVLRYDDSEDPEAVELRHRIREDGERAALAHYAGLGLDHPLVELVQRQGREGLVAGEAG